MSHHTPTSSVMDGASLALIGTMLKMLLSTHHQVWPLDNIPYTHSWAQNFSFWCGQPLTFWQMFQLSTHSRSFRPAYWSLSLFYVILSPLSPLCSVGKNQTPAW